MYHINLLPWHAQQQKTALKTLLIKWLFSLIIVLCSLFYLNFAFQHQQQQKQHNLIQLKQALLHYQALAKQSQQLAQQQQQRLKIFYHNQQQLTLLNLLAKYSHNIYFNTLSLSDKQLQLSVNSPSSTVINQLIQQLQRHHWQQQSLSQTTNPAESSQHFFIKLNQTL